MNIKTALSVWCAMMMCTMPVAQLFSANGTPLSSDTIVDSSPTKQIYFIPLEADQSRTLAAIDNVSRQIAELVSDRAQIKIKLYAPLASQDLLKVHDKDVRAAFAKQGIDVDKAISELNVQEIETPYISIVIKTFPNL